MKTTNKNNNNSNINTENMNMVGNNANGENAHNCVMSSNGTFKQFTLTEEAITSIEEFRNYEKYGGCHEKFFFDIMKIISDTLYEEKASERDKKLSNFFYEATYFCNILTNIVKTK